MSHADTPLIFADRGKDWLDRGPAVSAIRKLLESPDLATPLVLGIYGGWGTGKTSVMQTLREELESKSRDRLMVWFDAWIYARQEQALWRALLLRVVETLRTRFESPDEHFSPDDLAKARQELDEARASLYRSQTIKERGAVRVNWWGALPLAADAALTALTAGLNKQVEEAIGGKGAEGGITAALTKWFKGKDTQEAVKLIEREASERYVEQVVSLEQFQAAFQQLLKRFGVGEKGRRLFIFVDDLDRCLPEDAVAALEAIKLFLDLPGCVFVLGMDREVVEQGIRVRYKALEEIGFDARAYLDKIIQVPFNLPPLGADQVGIYLNRLSGAIGQGAFKVCRDLIRSAAPPNPRALKRVLNALLLTLYLDGYDDARLQRLAENPHEKDRVRLLAKLVLLQVCFGAAWQGISERRCSLKDAEKVARGENVRLGNERTDLKELFRDQRLKALFEAEPRFGALVDDEIQRLLTLSKVTASD